MGKRSRLKREREPLPQVATAPQEPARKRFVSERDRRNAMLLAAALFVATLIAYAGVLRHEFVTFDDPLYVSQNDHVRTGLSASNVAWAFTAFHAFNWHPLTWISLMLDVALFGVDAGKIAFVNALIHAISSVVLLFLMRRMTERTWPSAAIAALFALHPAHVESVAWVSERKDVLSTLLFLLTIWLYVAWLERRTPARYAAMLGVFALALMAKPMVVTLPFVLLLLDWWPLRRGITAQNVVEKLPLFALLIPAVILTLMAQAKGIAVALPLSSRIANAVQSYGAYLLTLAWPSKLAIMYPLRPVGWAAAVSLVVLIAITIAALRAPFATTGWLWYLGTLVPVIGIVQVGRQAMADRYTYIPSIGICIIVVFAIDRLPLPRRALIGATTAIVAVLAVVTIVQTRVWQNSVTLYRHAIDVTADNDIAHTLLGETYRSAGDMQAAQREFDAAITINPHNEEALRNAGLLQLALNEPQKAVPLLDRALKEHDDVSTRAALEAARGNVNGALAAYAAAVRERPELADRHNDYAAMLARAGHDDEALREYEAALRISPDQYDVRMNLGAILSRRERNDDAIAQFRAAAEQRPASPEPHVYLALVYAAENRFQQALDEVRTAMSIDHDAANAQLTNAVHIPPGPNNIDQYAQFLASQRR